MTDDSAGQSELRGVLVPLLGTHLLLPSATFVEVIHFRRPEPVEGPAPGWLLGNVAWRRIPLPVLSIERAMDRIVNLNAPRLRIAVCYMLEAGSRVSFAGILSQGIPRLVRIAESQLEPLPMPPGVTWPIIARVRHHDEECWIPDLDRMRKEVGAAFVEQDTVSA